LTDNDFQVLAKISDFPAREMVYQQNFTLRIRYPNRTCDHCLLRFRYVSNNPDEASRENPTGAFYQCVDIQLTAPIEPLVPAIIEEKIVAPAAYSCCTVPQFEARATAYMYHQETSIEYDIFWDATNKLARWDAHYYSVDLRYLYQFRYYTNYTSLREYVYNPDKNTCELTGPDAIYNWCYGTVPQMEYRGRGECIRHVDRKCDQFSMDNGYEFHTLASGTSNTCTPYAAQHRDHSGTTTYVEFKYFKEGVSQDVFKLPAACNK